MKITIIWNILRTKLPNLLDKKLISSNSKKDLAKKKEKDWQVIFIRKLKPNQTSISHLMKTRRKRTLRSIIKNLQATLIDTHQSFFHTKMFIFKDLWIPRTWLKTSYMRSTLITLIWLICTFHKLDHKIWMSWAISLPISINLKPLDIKMNIWTTCTLNTIIDGENPQEHGSQRLKSLTT